MMPNILSPRTLTLLFVLSCTGSLIAQAPSEKVKVKVRISGDDDAKAKLRPVGIVRSGENHIMMLRSGEFDVRAFGTMKSTLDVYDRNKLTYVRGQEPSDRSSSGVDVKVDDLVYFAGGPLLIGHSNDDNGVTLHIQRPDPALTKVAPGYEPLVTWNADVKEKRAVVVQAGGSSRSPYGALVSQDSSHMLLCSPEIRNKETGSAVYLIAMINSDLSVKWTREVAVNDKAKHSSIEDLEVDNAGNAYFVVKNRIEDKEERTNKNRDELKLYVANSDGVQEAKLKLNEDNFATSATLKHTAEDKVVCAGVYGAQDVKKDKKIGNFVAVFDAGTGALGAPVLIPFIGNNLEDEGDYAEEEEAESKAESRDKYRLNYHTDVIGMFPGKDGAFYLVNEVNYSYQRQYASSTSSGSYTVYVHGPLQVRCMEADGTERWSTLFRRWVSTTSPIIGRVFCAEYEGQVFLFLLDSEEMAARRKVGQKISSKHIKHPYSAYVAFADDGDFKIKPVLKSEKNEDFISGWSLIRTGADEYFALGTEKLEKGRFLPVRIEFSKDAR